MKTRFVCQNNKPTTRMICSPIKVSISKIIVRHDLPSLSSYYFDNRERNNYTMSHDGARTLARSMKRNKMLRERVMDNNRGGVAGKVSEPIPTFHLHNTHYNTFIYLIFKDNYFLSVIVHSPRLVFQSTSTLLRRRYTKTRKISTE